MCPQAAGAVVNPDFNITVDTKWEGVEGGVLMLPKSLAGGSRL